MKRVALDSAVVTVLNVFGQLASFVLFAGIAALFGADWQTDAFFLAMTIPALFIGAAVNAITSVFIPVLTEYRIKRPDGLGVFVGSALLLITGLALAATLVIILIAPLVLSASSRGLSDATGQLAYQHTLLLSPMIAIQSAIGVLAAVYNAAQRFVLPAAGTVVRYLATLLLIWALRPALGVLSLSAAFVLGTLINLLLLAGFWPSLKLPLRLRLRLDPELVRTLRVAVPMILGTAALQVGIVVSRLLAAQLPPGSVSVLDYATRISSAIMEVLTSGIFLVTLADWSSLVAQDAHEELRKRLKQTVLVVLFFVTPVVAMLLVLREPIIILVLQRGAFQGELVRLTAGVMALLLIAIPLDVVGRTYIRLFLVWRETYVIGGLATLRVFVMAALALVLMPTMGLFGIALADTGALALVAVALVALANRKLGNTLAGLWLPIAKLVIAAAGCGVAILVASGMMHHLSVWAMLPLSAVVGGLCYLFLSWMLRIQELTLLSQLFTRWFIKG